jgi:type II secretion system protein N
MKARLIRIAKWLAYPAFYLFCLGVFGYLTFPYDRLKDRLIAEFERAQSKKASTQTQKLEIDKLTSYWFTGVEVSGARLILPPEQGARRGAGALLGAGGGAKDKADAPKPSVIEIEEGHVRVRLLPLLIGRVRLDFSARVFGGEVEGVVPVGKSGGKVEVEVSNVDLSKVEPLAEALGGIPLSGTVSAKLTLEAPGGKFNKADGSLELTLADLVVSDGKTKIQGLIELPPARLGELTLSAEAKEGVLKVTKLSAPGPDIELEGDGKINVREPWNNSIADLYVRFKFADGYRTKTPETKSLLGDPAANLPPAIETFAPKMKRAKRADGFYGWHVHGQLKRVKFDPHASDAPATRSRGKGGDSPFSAGAKKPSLNLPGGPTEASPSRVPNPGSDDEKPERAPPPPPPPEEPRAESPPPPEPPAREPPPEPPAREPPPEPPSREPPNREPTPEHEGVAEPLPPDQ